MEWELGDDVMRSAAAYFTLNLLANESIFGGGIHVE